MWSIAYLNKLRRAYFDFLKLRDYCTEQMKNHYDVYKIVENYGKYGIPFENLNYKELEVMAKDITIMYKLLRTEVIDDFIQFYSEHEAGYQDGLHLYVAERTKK